MTVKYYLDLNHITSDPNDYFARVSSKESYDQEQLISIMMGKGTSATRPDIRGILTLFFAAICEVVADGNSVNLPVANFKPSIKGIFNDITEPFDPSKHEIKASVSPGIQLLEAMSNALVEKISMPEASPRIDQVKDFFTKTVNTFATKGNIVQLTGEQMKFGLTSDDEGVFFVNEEGVAEKVPLMARHTDTFLMFNVPMSLVNGNYYVEVRRMYTKNNEIRVGRFKTMLTVS